MRILTKMEKYYDVIIVGTGVAGCFNALHLPCDKKILMITKAKLNESDSDINSRESIFFIN